MILTTSTASIYYPTGGGQPVAETSGLAEYWLFDPKGEWMTEQLRGYRLIDEEYVVNPKPMSHQLGLRLEVATTSDVCEVHLQTNLVHP
jgi:Uma2 family endonuclease